MPGESDLDVKVTLETVDPPAAAPEPKDPGEQYRASIDRYREAAKWAVGAFGSIGALLVAALPLVRLGAGSANDSAQTVWGTVLALGGVTLAIAAMLSVLAPRSVFSFELKAKSHSALARLLSGTWSMEHMLHEHGSTLLPVGITDVAGLTAGIENLDKLIPVTERQPSVDPSAVEALEARQAMLVETQQHLTWIARVEKMRAAFHISSALILVAGLAVGAGVGLLFDALYDDSTAARTEAETAKITAETAQLAAGTTKIAAETDKITAEAGKVRAETPAAGQGAETDEAAVASAPSVAVLLTEEGQALLPTCPVPEGGLPGILIAGSSSAGWEVVVLPTETCVGGWLTLTPELGTVR